MKADNISLLEFISSGKRTFCIPVYQRNYDWKSSQCTVLFKDIENIATDKKRESHFLGTIVYVNGESLANFREFIIIDGQQRLTSVMLLLKAIHDTTDDDNLKQEILECYLLNKYSPEPLRIKLKPMKSDCIDYQNLLNNEYDDMEASQITLNYKLFKQLIENSSLKPSDIFQGIQKLEIVYIQLAKERENPQLIFESLNSTGLDLTQADLIRNFLLMGQSYSKQEELYNNYWVKIEKILPDTLISDFIRDYLTLKTSKIPNKDKVYQSFKDYYNRVENFDAEGFLDELKTYAKYYSWFKYCNSPSNEINLRLSQLQRLKSTVVYPFLLNIFEDCFLFQNTDEDELCKSLGIIISYVMRRLLCELPTNALNKVFGSLSKDILKDQQDSLSEKLVKILLNKKGKAMFPSDSILKDKLMVRECYSFPYLKFVLEAIEKNESKENVDFGQLTIEHIMPQTLSAKWKVDLGKNFNDIHEKYLQRFGNLTLTGYNSELSNLSFSEKRVKYKESNLLINRKIYEFEGWGGKEIEKRSQDLIEKIISIWKRPDVSSDAQLESDMRTEFEINDDVDVTGRTPCELIICGSSFSVDSWRGFFKCICQQMYEYDAQIFRSLTRHNDFKGRVKRIINNSTEGLREAAKISEDIYIEQNLSANDALNYSKLVIDKFDEMDSEVSYRIR